MRVHAINTGKVWVKSRQMRGVGGGRTRAIRTMFDREWSEPLPILAWLVEHPDGLIVVDTGESAGVMEKGWFPRWHPYFRLAVRFEARPEDEIGPQIRALGFDPEDVKTVVMTHMHGDHAGGIPHFPRSEFLVARGEYEATKGIEGKINYLPQHLPQWFAPTLVDLDGWDPGHVVAPGVRIVPTPGHTADHVSVVVEDGERTLFIAGDASYREDLMREGVADGVTQSPETHLATLARIRAFVDEHSAIYLPTHDPESGARLDAAYA
ncbi:MAG TPA: N-acyl homoserine lactonase family protein [Solirubrobacteraceae bacterium]|jgi:glyoxylase-like metal-dependent hydrolase (beta-lactamase superfamily II)